MRFGVAEALSRLSFGGGLQATLALAVLLGGLVQARAQATTSAPDSPAVPLAAPSTAPPARKTRVISCFPIVPYDPNAIVRPARWYSPRPDLRPVFEPLIDLGRVDRARRLRPKPGGAPTQAP